MSNLAGFDVIAEVHLDTVTDLINLVPFTNPTDGKEIRLFGGPFSTDLQVPLGPVGTVLLRIFVEATLGSIVHQSQVSVRIKLSSGSITIAGRSLSNIGGQAVVIVPMGFALPPTAATAGDPQVPNITFSASNPHVSLNVPTRTLVEAVSGQGSADRLTDRIQDGLTALFNSVGVISIHAAGFTVLPGVASNLPNQLSAVPSVAWIDDMTLGVFGYYHVPATGGVISQKQNSDILQTGQ
jgi:hypothetical protein